MIETSTITTIEGFAAIGAEWEDLLKRSHNEHIFQTFYWNYTWFKHLGTDFRLNIILFRDGERLNAVMPLVYRTISHLIRRYEFMGPIVNNYFDIIADNAADFNEILMALRRYIDKNLRLQDFMELRFVPEDSPLYETLNRGSNILNYIAFPHTLTHIVRVESNFETYMMSHLSQKFRYEVRMKKRKIFERGDVSIESCTDKESADAMLDALFRMKIAWAEKIGEHDTFFKEQSFQDFDREICAILLERGELFAHVLKFDGKIVAVNFDFIYKGHVYCHEIAYDIDFDKRLSPGMVLIYAELEEIFNRGYKDLDFAQGEYWYKRQWCNSQRLTGRYYIFKGRPILRWIYLMKLRPYLKDLYVKLKT